MTATVHVTQFFSTRSPKIFDECDELMELLVLLEEADPTVRDAAVSADAGAGVVEVQVVADGDTPELATERAIKRIGDTVASIVDLVGSRALVERGHPISTTPCAC